jgi:hypothetical protein
MPHLPRSIAAVAVLGALSLFAAGCSAGDGADPDASPTRSASAKPTRTPTPSATATSAPSATGDPAEPGDGVTPDPGAGSGGQTDPDPGDFPATALVTFAGWDAASSRLQASGLVSGTTDGSGTCTFTATKDGTSRTATSAANGSASSINCAQVSFPAGQITTGTWNVTLTYAIGEQSTTSDPISADVP